MMQAALAVMQRPAAAGTILNVASLAGRSRMTSLGPVASDICKQMKLKRKRKCEEGDLNPKKGLK
jgi:hypothetical protein